MNRIVGETLAVARREVGVREEPLGSNWGPRVAQYLRRAGYRQPEFWCGAFVYWCIDEAGLRLEPASHWVNPFLRTGSCAAIEQWAIGNGTLTLKPAPGDVFLVRGFVASEGAYRAHHTGLVTAVNGDRVATVEGNTNAGGSSNGIGVFAREREFSHRNILAFVRWGSLLEPDLAGEWTLQPAGWTLRIRNGRALCPVRKWADYMGFSCAWDDDAQAVSFNGQVVPVSITLIDGAAYAPVRDLATCAGLTVTVQAQGRTVTLSRP
jgi:hypothetical protein